MLTTRRNFLIGCAGAATSGAGLWSNNKKPRQILLRGSWQTENIGDIAHTPGALRLFEQYLPEALIILWPGKLDRDVEPLLRRRFPKLRIVRDGSWRNPNARADDPTLEEAMREADLMIHGSGSGLGARAQLESWREKTGKPYGAYGVSVGVRQFTSDQSPDLPPDMRRTLEGAEFVFTRETRSLEAMSAAGIRCKQAEFAPDSTFAIDLRNEAAARALMRKAELMPDKFICVVPRLRITPYWETRPMPPEVVAPRKSLNEKYAEVDHAKLREVVVKWVRATGLKVLLCPEMAYEVNIIKPLLFDPLPEDVKPKVVPMDRYWLTDEAASVYRHARAVVSFECHSPIIAGANGRPAFYLRQPTDTWKGQMYRDIGLKEWIFEIEETSGATIAEALMNVHRDYEAAQQKLKQAMRFVQQRQSETMSVVVQKMMGFGVR
jgi:polysaccharide pyruvyl transferase WcaK-like protein